MSNKHKAWPVATLAAGLLFGAAAVAVAAPTWEKQFILSLSPSSEFGRGMRWVERPSDKQVFALYPEAAFAERVSGATTLECTSTIEGRLIDCTVVEEVPEGKGFAAASTAVIEMYRFGPVNRITPAMVDKKVKIAVIFQTRRNMTREVRP